MASAIKNASYYTIGSIIRAATSFLLLPVFSNALGAEQYGVLNLLQTFSTILGVFMTLATERSLFRLYYDYDTEEGKTEFLSTVFWTINGISAIMLLSTLLTGGFLAHFLGDVNVWRVLLPTVLYTFFMSLINYSQVLMQVEQKGKYYIRISILLLVIYNAFSLLFLYFYSKTVESLVYGQLIASFLVLPFAFGNVKKRIAFTFSVDILKSTLKYSIPIFITVSFSWVLNMTDRLFIANVGSLEDAGIYSLASKFTQLAVLFVGAVHQAYSPYFYNIANTATYEVAKNRLIPANKVVTLITCFSCVMIAMFIKPLLYLVFDPAYYGAVIFTYILCISTLFSQQCSLLNVMVYQNKKVKSMAAISIVCGLLSLLLNSIFVPRWGAMGAAISNLIVGLTLFGVTYKLARGNYYIPLSFSVMGFSLLVLATAGVVDVMVDNLLINLSCKIILLVLFYFVACVLRIITKQEITSLKKRMVGLLNNK